MTNAVINAKKAVDASSADEIENVPVLSTSVAYGVYMAVSSNLRYVKLCFFDPAFFPPSSLVYIAEAQKANSYFDSLLKLGLLDQKLA